MSEHMFQMSYTSSFSQYSSTFESNQTTTAIDVTGVMTRTRSLYLDGDTTCDPTINKAVLDTVPGQESSMTLVNSNLNHASF